MLPKIVFLKAPRPATETIRLVHDGVAYDVEAEPLMLKAQGIPAGARWITVHPNGRDQKGVPVLIQETQHGSGTFHVIGGAGGKLNYLKLRGVKSAGDYAQDVRERQTEKRKAKAEQTARDKAAGTHESKQKQRAVVKDAQRKAEREFVEHVAAKLGWAPDDMAPPPAEKLQGLSEKAQAKALETHHKALVQRATEAAGLAKARLVIEQDKRLADHLNEPMVDDPAREGLGYATDYTGRTADQAESIRQEAAALDDARTPPDKKEAAAKAKDTAGKIRDELKRADVPLADVKAKMVEANDAVDILKAAAKLKAVRKEAAKANKDIDAGRERKAFVLEVSDADLDQHVRDQLEQDLRTLKTRAFLEEVGKAGNEDALGRHLGAGAYNALNGVAITLGGQPVIDRDAVDVLGTAGAAQVLARALKQSMSPEDFAQATDALEAFHSDHYLQRSEEALRESAELHEQIKEMKLPDAEDGRDLQAAHELIERKREAIGKLRQHLGQALGEMEAHAALIVAMKGNTDAPVQVPLGQLKTEDAIRRLRAIGLNAGDYSLQFAGPEAIATVDPKGQDRLAAKPDPEHAKAVRDSLDIQQGRQDDPDFWPQGVARRPDLALKQNLPAGTARDFARPFEPGPNMGQSIRDYIGSRMADGHGIGDIVRDLQSEELAGQAGERRADYFQALNEVVPLTDADGKPIEHEARRADFERHADMHMAREYGGRFSPLHAQPLAVDDISAEAMHRALSAEPAGALAFKAVGELGPKDQGALRDYFDRHIGGQDEQTATLKRQLDEHTAEGQEPERETEDMFGRGTNPAWVAWKQRREDLQEKLRTSGLPWNRYVSVMGGPEHAYAAVQDHARGRVVQSFTEAHNKLRPDAPLKLGRTTVRNHIAHLDAVDPAAREKRLAEQREMIDGLRNRIAGRYSAGSVRDRMEASREAQQALEQSQLGFFATAPESKAQAPLGKDERHTVGAAAEQQLARLAEHVGTNFQPGQPVKLSPPTMTGKFVAQQRSIKLIERNKRLALGLGVGSGKTAIGLNSFAHLHSQGKVKRGIYAVPSIVQGQFGNEALNMLEPGKFKWHAQPGASREERLAAYKDPGTHFSVVTHQGFRDDMLHLGAQQAGIEPAEMSRRVSEMSPAERKTWARGVMDAHGMDHDFMMVDEGHGLLDRAGKEDSGLSNVLGAVSANMTHYVSASADPVKNDASEAFSLLQKIAPDRYTDRAAFMRRYGVDTVASKDQLRREMAPYLYSDRIDPGVRVHKREVPVELSGEQKADMAKVDEAAAKLRLSRLAGSADVDAAKLMSPDSFEGVPEEQHAEVAKRLAQSVGILHETAAHRILSAHPKNNKTEKLVELARERKGKPGVVFARSRDAVAQIAQRLRDEGHRVVTITGSDSAKEKSAKRLKFRPEQGEPEADILVASDAGATGLNAQRGAWLMQYDTPLTAMTHAQRNGRIHRLGQKNPDIETIDLVANHPKEHEARRRLTTKYRLRDALTSPLEHTDDSGFAGYLRQRQQQNDEQGGLF